MPSWIALAASLAQPTTKPIIAGETFTFGPVRTLITTTCSAGTVGGWIGQYDGRQFGDPCPDGVNPFGCALFDAWYATQRDFGPTMQAGGCPPIEPGPVTGRPRRRSFGACAHRLPRR